MERETRMVQPRISELNFYAREAINMLRGSVQMAGYQTKVFAVTSALAHEGKSSLAFRLACSLAGLDRKRVVYVDSDIRNSHTKRRYKIRQKTVGLSEYLCGAAEAEDIVYATDNPQMDLVFCGKSAPNPSELCSGNRMDALLAQLKANYDYVIVDTPPVNLVVDTAIIAPKCDAVLVVVECGVTAQRELVHTIDVLERSNAKILGVVLNKVDSRNNRYGKYGLYGRYGKQYGYGRYGYGKYGYGKRGYGYGEEKK